MTESTTTIASLYEAYHREAVGRFIARLDQADAVRPLLERFSEYLSRPGKRLRPLLLMRAAEAAGALPLETFLPAAYAVEAFHSFILIHDDVIDGSSSRRGRPSLHADIVRRLGAPRQRGEHLAIVLGDLLYGYALEALNEVVVRPGARAEAIRYFSRVIQDTGLGEALELSLAEQSTGEVSEAAIEKVYHLKTTRYTFEAPLVLGAQLAGLEGASLEALEGYALPVGRAFQVANDLHEIGEVLEGRVERAYDLAGEIRTLYLRRLAARLEPADRDRLETAPDRGEAGVASMAGLIRGDCGRATYRELRQEVFDGFVEGRRILERAVNDGLLPDSFLEIAELVEARFEHSEAAAV